MRKYQLGFIGCGNMGRAMMAGALSKAWTTPERVVVHTQHQESMAALAENYGVEIVSSNRAVAAESEMIILAVKPYLYKAVLEDIRDVLTDGQIVVAIAPAYSIDSVAKIVKNDGVRIARAMPNTPAQIGMGMAGIAFSNNMSEEECILVKSFFESFGKVAEVREDVMHAVGSVSGAAPAFIYMVIEGMAEGAVKLGIPAKDAYTFAAQTVLGAAAMVLETGTHPAALRDAVCSAGGTTIEGVAALEERGLKAALIEAMDRASKKSLVMEANAVRELEE